MTPPLRSAFHFPCICPFDDPFGGLLFAGCKGPRHTHRPSEVRVQHGGTPAQAVVACALLHRHELRNLMRSGVYGRRRALARLFGGRLAARPAGETPCASGQWRSGSVRLRWRRMLGLVAVSATLPMTPTTTRRSLGLSRVAARPSVRPSNHRIRRRPRSDRQHRIPSLLFNKLQMLHVIIGWA
jgi:hypothetical protein